MALKALMAFLSRPRLPWGLPPPQPVAQEPHFGSAWGSGSSPQRRCRGARLQPCPCPCLLGGSLGPTLSSCLRPHLLLLLTGLSGAGSSLASCGAVSGPCYQQLALPAMSSPHGTAPSGEGMAQPGVTSVPADHPCWSSRPSQPQHPRLWLSVLRKEPRYVYKSSQFFPPAVMFQQKYFLFFASLSKESPSLVRSAGGLGLSPCSQTRSANWSFKHISYNASLLNKMR